MTPTKPARRDAMLERENALFRSALSVMIERNGGLIEFAEAEFLAICARLGGDFELVGEVEKSGVSDPVIRVRLRPATVMQARRAS